jgi:hypothetical protein
MVFVDLIKVALVAIALFLVAIGFFIIPRPHPSSALTPATVTEIHDAISWERDREIETETEESETEGVREEGRGGLTAIEVGVGVRIN